MGLNNITFVLGQGGLGRPLPGQDHISGLIFFTGTLPSGFASDDRVKEIFSVADAEALGIKDDYSDATAAAGEVEVTAIGANGDTVQITVLEPGGVLVDLGTYTKGAGETTVTLVGDAIEAMINANTNVHGYTAENTAGAVAITAPKRLGIFLNSGTPLVATDTGTIATTATQFSGGVASLQAVWHYHISEYFRVQPKGDLYIGFFAVPGAYTYTAEVAAMQTKATGTIRQIGVYKNVAAAATGGDLTALHAACNAQVALHKEVISLLSVDMAAVTDLSTLYDMSLLTANLASMVIAQDGGALGATLYLTTGKSISTLGACLGAISLAKVSENIAWVQKFNISNGVENDIVAFANGKLLTDASITENLLSALQDRRYIFLRKFVGVAGSYWNDDLAAVAASSDYSFISNNRTIQKATRGVYAGLVPALNSPLVLNADGTLSENTIAYLETLAESPLDQMIRDTELSAFDVAFNPAQDVLATSKVIITISLVPIGSARNIQVNIGFNVSIN
jgi:hypothetical protein